MYTHEEKCKIVYNIHKNIAENDILQGKMTGKIKTQRKEPSPFRRFSAGEYQLGTCAAV